MTRRAVIAAAGALAVTPAAAVIAPLLPGVRLRPDREAMVSVPGGRAYVRINGDLGGPRPPIVLLHGGPGSSHWYFLNATAMAGERAVILYDQLDSGFARVVPGARFAEVAGAAHMIMNDNPAAYLAVLVPWLRQHDT